MATRSKAIRLSLICSAAVFVIVALITLVLVLVFDRLFLSILYKQLAILPGSTVFESWSAPSVPVYFSVYLFNLTNEAELLKGAAPRLHEVGPFVYRENREKFDIVFPEEISPKTVDFKHRIFYHFVPEMSVASPELGKITIPNLFTAGLLERQSPVFFMNGPFATLSPYDAMWNHYPLLFSSINVGLFASQNGTKPVQYKIHTGSHDISKVGSIIEVNGQKKLSVWDHEEANMINGSDGSNAPPGLEVGSTIQFYVNDICRSVVSYAVAKTQAINRPDIELLVFTGTPPDPQDPANDWRQRMFCKSGQGCPPKGLLALSPCLAATGESVPLYLSQPYFLGADPSIVQAFDQFPDPIPERHSTWVHIEPTTGFVLEAFKRIQFNLLMKNQGEIFQDMAGPYYFPLGWIEERAVADKDTLDMLHNKLFAPRKIMPFILSVVGAVSTLISILLIVLLVTYSRRRTIQNRTKRSGAHKQHAVSVNLSHSKMGPSDQVQIVQPNQYADRQQTPGLSSGPGANTQVPEAKPLLNVTETADVNRV